MHHTEVSEKIKGYGLKGQLNARLGIVIRGGVSRNMVYKAMSKGPITPLAKIILHHAETLVSDHENEMSDKLFQMECETAT